MFNSPSMFLSCFSIIIHNKNKIKSKKSRQFISIAAGRRSNINTDPGPMKKHQPANKCKSLD
jgi:hypothetical protein